MPFWKAMRLPRMVLRLSVGASSAADAGLAQAGRKSPRSSEARTRPEQQRAGRNDPNYASNPFSSFLCFGHRVVNETPHRRPAVELERRRRHPSALRRVEPAHARFDASHERWMNAELVDPEPNQERHRPQVARHLAADAHPATLGMRGSDDLVDDT